MPVNDCPPLEPFELVSSWIFDGQGYLDLDQAAAAIESAVRSRMRRTAMAAAIHGQETRKD